MRNSQVITLLLLGTIFTIAVVLTLISFGIMSGPTVATVSDVDAGCQEIALLLPATNFEVWERLLGAMEQVRTQWQDRHKEELPALVLDTNGAFPAQSAGVPQFAVSAAGSTGK